MNKIYDYRARMWHVRDSELSGATLAAYARHVARTLDAPVVVDDGGARYTVWPSGRTTPVPSDWRPPS